MLVDVFSERYREQIIWASYGTNEQKLLTQLFGLAKEALPYYASSGSVNKKNEESWKAIHDQVAREIGLKELAPRYYSYKNQSGFPVSGFWGWDYVCEQFVLQQCDARNNSDSFIKERLNVVELVFRKRFDEIQSINNNLPHTLNSLLNQPILPRTSNTINLPGSRKEGLVSINNEINERFNQIIEEVNERFRRSLCPLSVHNGYFQLAIDQTIEQSISKPFWKLLEHPQWRNVDTDIKEAIDRRDSNQKDPALYAGRALESTIKIISDAKKWTSGTERGAANYIDNLSNAKNGAFISQWEANLLKGFFREVRNPLSHGAGNGEMRELNLYQTDWAIETVMSWVRTLVRRM